MIPLLGVCERKQGMEAYYEWLEKLDAAPQLFEVHFQYRPDEYVLNPEPQIHPSLWRENEYRMKCWARVARIIANTPKEASDIWEREFPLWLNKEPFDSWDENHFVLEHIEILRNPETFDSFRNPDPYERPLTFARPRKLPTMIRWGDVLCAVRGKYKQAPFMCVPVGWMFMSLSGANRVISMEEQAKEILGG